MSVPSLLGWFVMHCVAMLPLTQGEDPPSAELRVLTWNIGQAGSDPEKPLGSRQVLDVLRGSQTDLIAIQETMDSESLIAKGLGFHLHSRGTKVSIISRFPIVEDISVCEESKCVGVIVQLPGQRQIAFYSICLPRNDVVWAAGTRDVANAQSLRDACRVAESDLQKIHDAIQVRLADSKYVDVPVIIAGDFSTMSHLDYAEVAHDQYHLTIEWPASRLLIAAGFRDAYRELHPRIDRRRDRTWSPRFPTQEQDRIDFVYYRGSGIEAVEASVVDSAVTGFHTDHAAVSTRLRIGDSTTTHQSIPCRVVSYNIKHGLGMDDRVDLNRTAQAIRALVPDIVGLQEVDLGTTRSAGINQAAELGGNLDLHAAFGSFMDYQGGQYGLAILSRYPFRQVHSIRLPEGNEPRITLAAEVRLPNGESLMIVNIHLDWVDDDNFRFAQASAVVEFLGTLKMPYVLIGDFNDGPDSRTLQLFKAKCHEASKPPADRFTFSSTQPVKEIDFVFLSPRDRWEATQVRVITEPVTSDHRPVLAELEFQLLPEKKTRGTESAK